MSVLAIIEQGKQQPARKLSWGDEMRARCSGLETGLDMGAGKDELSWMIGEMTGVGAIDSQPTGVSPSMNVPPDFQGDGGFATGLDEYVNLGTDWATPMVDVGDTNFTGWGAVGKI